MDQGLFRLVEEIAFTAINFIIVNSITSAASKQTVTDLKTDLRSTKEDLMNQIKETKSQLEEQVKESETKLGDLLNEKTKSSL